MRKNIKIYLLKISSFYKFKNLWILYGQIGAVVVYGKYVRTTDWKFDTEDSSMKGVVQLLHCITKTCPYNIQRFLKL